MPPAEAFFILLENHILSGALHTSTTKFKRNVLYFQEMENVYLAFWGDLRLIYTTYCDKTSSLKTVGKATHMSMGALCNMYWAAEYLDSGFTR